MKNFSHSLLHFDQTIRMNLFSFPNFSFVRYFENLFGFDKETNLKTIYENYKELTEEIEKYEEVNKNEPHLRIAHKKLAEEIITFLHGHEEYEKAVHISEALFKGNIKELSHDELVDASKNMDSFQLNENHTTQDNNNQEKHILP